jgi:predicted RNA-binding Zn-ribbon protein involved in translation (DUF1610 family)
MSPTGNIVALLKSHDFAAQRWRFLCPSCADRGEQNQTFLIYNRERLKEVARLFGREVANCSSCGRDLIGEDRESRTTRPPEPQR